MQICRISLGLFMILALVSAATAQEFWVKKPFNEWSSEELKKFMSSSPWVKDLTMATQPPRGDGLDMNAGSGRGGDEFGGVDAGADSSEGRAGGGGRGGRGGGGRGNSPALMTVIVAWQSALPVKQAVVRSRMGRAGEVPSDAQPFLETVDSEYLIMISGMPQNIARQALSDASKVKKSVLRVGKREIPLVAVNTSQRGPDMDILLRFDRSQPIQLQDNEVEVDARLGMFGLKKKFKLKDMVFNGKLEL